MMFVVVTDGACAIECEGLREAVDRFEARVYNVRTEDGYAPGTTVEVWVAEQWAEDVGLPLETWTKGAERWRS